VIKIVITPKINRKRISLKTLSDIFENNDADRLIEEAVSIVEKQIQAVSKWKKKK